MPTSGLGTILTNSKRQVLVSIPMKLKIKTTKNEMLNSIALRKVLIT